MVEDLVEPFTMVTGFRCLGGHIHRPRLPLSSHRWRYDWRPHHARCLLKTRQASCSHPVRPRAHTENAFGMSITDTDIWTNRTTLDVSCETGRPPKVPGTRFDRTGMPAHFLGTQGPQAVNRSQWLNPVLPCRGRRIDSGFTVLKSAVYVVGWYRCLGWHAV